MKKLLFSILALFAIISASAHDFEVDGIYYRYNDDGVSVSVTYRGSSYNDYKNEYSGDLVIPSNVTYNGATYAVTSIDPLSFYNCGMNSVIIGNSVTTISSKAFEFSGLKSVSIPNSVTYIGDNAFYYTNLTTVSIPNSVTHIGLNAFMNTPVYDNQPDGVIYFGKVLYRYKGTMANNCNVDIIDGTISISPYAFDGCSGLTSITIPNTVISIGKKAFYNCSGLTSITLPNSIISLDDYAFSNCNGLTSIILPNSIKSIGRSSFENCTSLTSVSIPNSVTSIGKLSFYNCTALSSIDIPDSVNRIQEAAFQNCTGLSTLSIGNSVNTIESFAFSKCSKLSSVVIPPSVSYIGTLAFQDCNSLKKSAYSSNITSGNPFSNGIVIKYPSDGIIDNNGLIFDSNKEVLYYVPLSTRIVVIPKTVTSINKDAFKYCNGLISVKYDAKNISEIDSQWLNGCNNICKFFIGDSVITIPQYLCNGLSKVTNISIPNSVTTINKYAFNGCVGLTSIMIPKNVVSISSYAFNGCTNLTSITYNADNITSSVNGWLEGCYNISTFIIGDNVKTIPQSLCSGLSKVSSIIIPDSVVSIGKYAFSGCTKLDKITIPKVVNSIGYYAFEGCQSLNSVYFNSENISGSVNGWLNECSNITNFIIGSTVKILPSYLCNGLSKITNVNIPQTVSTIGQSAFEGCISLKSISIPKLVTFIGDSAYKGCYNLTEVTLGDYISTIGLSAFENCIGLKTITIPKSVTYIGDSAFKGCSGLSKVIYNADNVETALNEWLNKCDNISSFIIGNNVKTIPDNLCRDLTKITSISIPYSAKFIGKSSFLGCSGLKYVEIPSSVQTIGECAFQNCTSMKAVTIGINVTSIGNSAFSGCEGLTDVVYFAEDVFSPTSANGSWFVGCNNISSFVLGESVKTVPNYLCYNLSKLTQLYIPNSVISIGNYAFENCTGLISVSIPNSVTTIGKRAFYNCEGLKFITFSKSLNYIGESAFCDCTGLTSVIIPSSVTNIGKNAFYCCFDLIKSAYPENLSSNPFSNGKSIAYPSDGIFDEHGFIYDKKKEILYFVPLDNTTTSIPITVTSIGDYAFYGCDQLEESSVNYNITSLGQDVYGECSSLSKLTILSTKINLDSSFKGCFTNMPQTTDIYAFSSQVNRIKEYWAGNVYELDNPVKVTDKESGLTSCRCKIKPSTGYEIISISTDEGHSVKLESDGYYYIREFSPDTDVNAMIRVKDLTTNEEFDYVELIGKTKTASEVLTIKKTGSTQTSVSFSVSLNLNFDKPSSDKIGVYSSILYEYKSGNEVKFTIKQWSNNGVAYNSRFFPYIEVNGVKYYGQSISTGNNDLGLIISNVKDIYPISFTVNYSHSKGDAVISSQKISYCGQEFFVDGDPLVVEGLDPNSNSNLYYTVVIDGKEYYTSTNVTLPALEWTDGEAIALNTTTARLKYAANLPDDAPNTGFEWRRVDAPDIVASSKVGCICVDGYLVGTLNKLNPDVYYKFRPFYQSTSGKIYYGEWVGIFTGDASVFFKPEIITKVPEVETFSAVLKGYVIQGSENINSQGFEYRPVSSSNMSRADASWTKVTATGTNMSVEIKDLTPGTTYEYRCFVTTDTDTYYSELAQFTTNEYAGFTEIEAGQFTLDVKAENSTVLVRAYNTIDIVRCTIYSMNGSLVADESFEATEEWTSVANIRQGIYIIRAVSGNQQTVTRFVIR